MKRNLFWLFIAAVLSPAYSEPLFTKFVNTQTKEKANVIQQDTQQEPISKGDDDEDNAFLQQLKFLQNRKLTNIEIKGIKNSTQLNNAEVFLGLMEIKGKKITQPFYVDYLISHGEKEIADSQKPFGYYATSVTSTRKLVGKEGLTVVYQVTLGQPVKIKEVSVEITGGGKSDPAFQQVLKYNPLKIGKVLIDKTYEDYKTKFTNVATKKGYFDGTFSVKQIVVIPEENAANIKIVYDTGVRYKFSNVSFVNQNKGQPDDIYKNEVNDLPLNDSFLQRYVQFHPGDSYQASSLTDLQSDLQSANYFSQVLVGGEPDHATKTVPVVSQLTMNKNKHYAFGLGYSTDMGPHGKYNYDWRWANRNGHDFTTGLVLSKKNSELKNIYKIPAKNPATDYYYFSFGGWRRDDKYRSNRGYVEGGYNWRRDKWEYRASLTEAYDNFTIGNDSNKTNLFYPTLQAIYTSTQNRLNPPNGFQAKVNIRGAKEDVLSQVSFLQTNFNLRYVQPLNSKNRLIFHYDAGANITDHFHKLPPALRYFTGGDNSIRGYGYQDIGPRDSSRTNIGGKYLSVGSGEYEHFVTQSVALATFVDAGDAFTRTYQTKVGAGVGVHWYSPVGPIKVDLGHGFNKEYGSNVRFSLTIGAQLDL